MCSNAHPDACGVIGLVDAPGSRDPMRLLSIEVALALLIRNSTHTRAHRRVNEIENQLANMAKLGRPIDVLRELRLTGATSEELFAWVTEHEPPAGDVVRRLDQYTRVALVSSVVRDGWLQVNLDPH